MPVWFHSDYGRFDTYEEVLSDIVKMHGIISASDVYKKIGVDIGTPTCRHASDALFGMAKKRMVIETERYVYAWPETLHIYRLPRPWVGREKKMEEKVEGFKINLENVWNKFMNLREAKSKFDIPLWKKTSEEAKIWEMGAEEHINDLSWRTYFVGKFRFVSESCDWWTKELEWSEYNDVLKILGLTRFSERPKREGDLRKNILEILQSSTNRKVEQQQGIAHTYDGKFEAGPDIVVDDKLGIELKILRSSSDMDRTVGQILRYSTTYPKILLYFFGHPHYMADMNKLLKKKEIITLRGKEGRYSMLIPGLDIAPDVVLPSLNNAYFEIDI